MYPFPKPRYFTRTEIDTYRALDGLNTHDDSYALSIAGGVTTSLILPGSANAIGEDAGHHDVENAMYLRDDCRRARLHHQTA
jgi:hypothetical protein